MWEAMGLSVFMIRTTVVLILIFDVGVFTDKIISLPVEDDKVCLNNDNITAFKQLFSGCRVSFLLGAGFSADVLELLDNNEIIFEALDQYLLTPLDDKSRKKALILRSFLYWSFFTSCIAPIEENIGDELPTQYYDFEKNLYTIFSERGNPALDRQFCIFTTNYDPIIEIAFDNSNCICNDGFEGRICPRFSTDNYSKSYYRQAVYSNRKAEIPSLNLVKLHGSLTWGDDMVEDGIVYRNYSTVIENFVEKYAYLFDSSISYIIHESISKAQNKDDAILHIDIFVHGATLNSLINNFEFYTSFLEAYKNTFIIVNPTKEKFSNTLLNKNYYELLRIFSNELEKENTLLVSFGFSFRDEHIMDLIKRSMLNPALKLLVFFYKQKDIEDYQERFEYPQNNNITYVCLECGTGLSLKYLNQILSEIHI